MYPNLKLTDDRLLLRPIVVDDLKGLFAANIESAKENKRWFPWFHEEYSINDTKQWIATRQTDWSLETELSFVITEIRQPQILGCIGLNRFERLEVNRANLGYWVRTSATGRGIATAASKLVAKYGFQQRKLDRIEIVAAVNNLASQRVAEKLGTHREGIARCRTMDQNELSDAVVYSLIPGDVAKWEDD